MKKKNPVSPKDKKDWVDFTKKMDDILVKEDDSLQENREKNKLTVILTGKRRNYLIQNLESLGITYRYFEMVDMPTLNELYNLLDLYVVSSRLEGGPQAIVECATSMTPIISTKVGVAPQILNPKSIFDQNDVKSFFSAETDVDYAKKQVEKYETPGGFNPFLNLLTSIYES